MPGMMESSRCGRRDTLETLPLESLASVLCHLSVKDIRNVASTCKSLHTACRDEKLWFILCETTWSLFTDVCQWIVPPHQLGDQESLPSPATYCELFHLLRHIQGLCGYWRVIGEGPLGSFVRFSWCDHGIQGQAIVPKSFRALETGPSSSKKNPLVDLEPYHNYYPRQGEGFVVEWGSEDKGVVTLIKSPRAGGGSPQIYRSPSAEAAAAASMSTVTDSNMLGSSPEGSFEHSWLEFMSTKVAKPSRRRRSLRDSTKSDKSSLAPQIYHLRRVNLPSSSVCHPLAGIWVGNDNINGPLVIRVKYDFLGPAARIVGEKISGGGTLAAGGQCWWAYAAAVSMPPTDASEESLMQSLLERLDAETLDGLDSLLLEDGGIGDHTNGNGNGSSNTAFGLDRQINKVHIGGSKDDDQRAAEGRLWSFMDGSLVFWWLGNDNLPETVRLRRLIMHRLDMDTL